MASPLRRFIAGAAALAMALWPALAFAQSSPGWVNGQIPTNGQFNAAFAAKLDNPSNIGAHQMLLGPLSGSGPVGWRPPAPSDIASATANSFAPGDTSLALPAGYAVYKTTIPFTASHIWTLPASSSQGFGFTDIIDAAETLGLDSLTICAQGSDTLNGGAPGSCGGPYQTAGADLRLYNDGLGNWVILSSGGGGSGGGFGGQLLGANFNSTADQAIPIICPPSFPCIVDDIYVDNASVALSTAVGGIYTGPGKTGGQVVAAGQAYSQLTTNAANASGNSLSFIGAIAVNTGVLYLSLSTPQGAPATADVHVHIFNPFGGGGGGGGTAGIDQLTGDVLAGPGSGSQAAALAATGVAAGTYPLASVTVDAKGRITAAASPTVGTAPVASACGTGPAITATSTNFRGTVTEGITATGCTIAWAVPAPATPPYCVVSSPNGAALTSYAADTAALTIVNPSNSGNQYNWICSP